MLLHSILAYGISMSAVLTMILLGSIAYNPMLWLRTYPEDVKSKVQPKNNQGKKLALIFQIPFLIIMIGVPIFSTAILKSNMGNEFSFWIGFANFAGISSMFNLVDTVIIDWIIFCKITPKFIIIEGTERMEGYKDYTMHLKAFIKGLIITIILSFVFSAFIYFI